MHSWRDSNIGRELLGDICTCSDLVEGQDITDNVSVIRLGSKIN